MAERVYFDNNATTRPLDEVVAAMLPFLREEYANPSSVHQFGQSVHHRIEVAREQVASLLNATPREIIFTSGGTESINLAIRGMLTTRPEKRHFVTSAVEHSSVKRLADALEEEGYRVDRVGVDRDGRLDHDELADRIGEDTALVSLMWANNETGVLFDVERIAELAQQRGVPLHLDAVQAAGKLPMDVSAVRGLPVQLLSIAAHKFHGPKGVGALFVRRRTRIAPLLYGGRQERELRAGTENVAAIVGMGVACEHARTALAGGEYQQVRRLRDRLEAGLLERMSNAHVHGGGAERIINTTNIGFEGLEAEAILLLLSENGICASSGSACSSGSLEPSHVLKAMGIEPSSAHGAVRFSLSRFNTEAEVDHVVAVLPGLLERLTALSHA
jgi:cysteine desulfurase